MQLQEFYQAMGADYHVIHQRLHDDARIKKYLLQTAADPSFTLLKQSMETKDYVTAFRAAHSIKGICLNLELCTLLRPVEQLVEALRDGAPDPQSADALYEDVAREVTKMTTYLETLE